MDFGEDRVVVGVGKRKLSMMRCFRQDICDESVNHRQKIPSVDQVFIKTRIALCRGE